MKKKCVFRALIFTSILFTFSLFFDSCSSSKDVTSPTTDSTGTGTLDDHPSGEYSISNLVTDSTATFAGGSHTLYYSLETGKAIDSTYAQTANWDICFTSIYNGEVRVNNGSSIKSNGYGGPGKGQIYLALNSSVESQYYISAGNTTLKKIPERSLFDSAYNSVTNASIAEGNWTTDYNYFIDYQFGLGKGWLWYDFTGAQFPNSPSDSVAHVSYALPRTFVIKTAHGYYAKLIIYSLYKDAPEIPTRSNKAGFLSFKYVIQKDGTTNLDL